MTRDFTKPPACERQQTVGDCACCTEAEEWGFAVEEEIREQLTAIADKIISAGREVLPATDRTQPVGPSPADKACPVAKTPATFEGRQGFHVPTASGILWRDETSGCRIRLTSAQAREAVAMGVLVEGAT